MGQERLEATAAIGPEDDEHTLRMYFVPNGWSDYKFDLELDGETTTYKAMVERFGKDEIDRAMERAHEKGCYYG